MWRSFTLECVAVEGRGSPDEMPTDKWNTPPSLPPLHTSCTHSHAPGPPQFPRPPHPTNTQTVHHSTLGRAMTSMFIVDTCSAPHHNCFMALFPGLPGWAGARRELMDSMVQGKINRGRHTEHPAGRHSIRTKQCPTPSSPWFYKPDALPASQSCQSTEGN